MKNLYHFLISVSIFIFLTGGHSNSQPINISGATGINGNYDSFTNAGGVFEALNNGGSQSGNNIIITINANVTAESGVTALNSGTWNSVMIRPSGPRTASGTVSAPLFNFNGADNVTIDGITSGGNSLTITNFSTGNSPGVSTIAFFNGSSNNKITKCNILGSSQNSANTAGGTIFFGTDTVSGNGNDNNIISKCNIFPASGTLPVKAILSIGSTESASARNSGNLIDSNYIADFFTYTTPWLTAGIYIRTGNDEWTISGNFITQTNIRTVTSILQYHGISVISGLLPGRFNIINNRIGYTIIHENGTGDSEFRGIIVQNSNESDATSIQGNIIEGIQLETRHTNIPLISSPFAGIFCQSGKFEIGNLTGNRVGGNGISIYASANLLGSSPVLGIYEFSNSPSNISNNQIENISVFPLGITSTSTGFTGIYVSTSLSGTQTEVKNNLISNINNNINGQNALKGIIVFSKSGHIFNNSVFNFSGFSTLNSSDVITGITVNNTAGTSIIEKNYVHSLGNTVTNANAVTITGYDLTLPVSTQNEILKNFCYGLNIEASNPNCGIRGIKINSQTTAVVSNNMITLGLKPNGNTIAGPYNLIGIWDNDAGSAATKSFYYNSVLITGNGVANGGLPTYCIRSLSIGPRVFANNIFISSRSNVNPVSGMPHYAVSYAGSGINPPGLVSDYNDIFATGTGGTAASYDGMDYSFPQLQSASGQESNSKNVNVSFANTLTGDLHLTGTLADDVNLIGTPIGSVFTDFDNTVRDFITPYIGAHEIFLSAFALNFDGVNDHVSMPDALTDQAVNNKTAITIEYWFKGSVNESAVRFQPDGSNFVVSGWLGQHIISTDSGYNGVEIGAGATDGNWHHIAMTWQKNTVNGFRSYLDGVLMDQRNSSDVNLPSISSGGSIGSLGGSQEFLNGSLDDVRIWNRALTQYEIQSFKDCEYNNQRPGLIAYYKFNQGFNRKANALNSSALDNSGNNHIAVLNNFALTGISSNWTAPGGIGLFTVCGDYASTLNFDGVNDHVRLPDSLVTAAVSNKTAITIEYWFKGSSNQSAVRFQPDGSNYVVAGWLGKHIISSDGGSANGISVGATATDGNWHHIAMTWQKNTVNGFRSYLDGVLVEQRNSANVNLPNINSEGYIGSLVGFDEFMNGNIDEVRIWNRSLSQSEIQFRMNCEIPESASGLLANYHFNQGIASSNNTGMTVLSDASGNNYNASLENFSLNGSSSNWVTSGGVISGESCSSFSNASTLKFDGINDHISLPNSLTSLAIANKTAITIEYWFKGTSFQSAVRFQPNGNDYVVAGWNGKHIISTDGASTGISVGAAATDGNWHHIAVTWQKNTVNGFRSYLDGVIVDQRNSANVNLPNITTAGFLGSYLGTGEYMNGSLDEIRIWNRALSQSEIQSNMNCEIPASASGLLANYHFNQGIDGSDNTGINSLTDASGNNFNGGLVNFALNGVTSNWSAPGGVVNGNSCSVGICNITAVPEGFYNPGNNTSAMKDTLRAYLHLNSSPYAMTDSASAVMDSVNLTGSFTFLNSVSGNYYIRLKHRNSVETWSKTPQLFSSSSTSYDFTSANTQAFGDNQIQVDVSPVRFAIYSGDVNQDGTIDLTDGSLIDNDAFNFESGYLPTDVNGDGIVDVADAVYSDNNGFNFIGKVTP